MIHRPTLRETLRYGRRPLLWARPPTCAGFPTWPFTLGVGFDYVAPGMHDQLQAYWKLGEASGTRVDSHGLNNLTDNNTVTQAAGIQGNAAQCTRANGEYLSIADNAALSTGDIDFSIAGWGYLDSLGVRGTLAAKFDSVPKEWQLYVTAANVTTFDVVDAGEAHTGRVTSSTLSASTWYFFVAWHDAAANTVNLQVNNGTLTSTSYTFGCNDSTSPFFIGQEENNYWDGRVDEVAFWKRVLTSDERSYLWNNGLGRTYPLTTP